jgi:mRNA interferase MazF
MVVAQGDVFWADLPLPAGSEPGFRRPVVVVQGDAFNESAIATVVCIPLTSNLAWAEAPGNVLLPRRNTGLSKESVANVSQIITIDREFLARRVGKISRRQLHLVLRGIDTLLGRS